MPDLCGDGWVIVGDAGQFVNSVHREGSNLAMVTGMVAGQTIADLKRGGKALSKSNLAAYKKTLDSSFVMKDMKKYKNIPGYMHANSKMLFGTYPRLIGQAAQNWFRVDGVDKRTKEKEILSSFFRGRKLTGVIGDAVKFARAWR